MDKMLQFLAILCGVISTSRAALTVQTDTGRVQGRISLTEDLGVPYYAFSGIPYAQPPVGNLRFEPPVPVIPWEGILDATEDAVHCIQDSDPVRGSEDCLFVNIYTSKNPDQQCDLLPVYFWIYGGGFQGGESAYEVYGPDYFLEKDLLVVTFNYRIGILGFLSTGDDVVPGNNGLKDQVEALKWVKRNIQNFCGDPEKITIGGQSAGSASVSYILQSPLSQGLYQRAILQSGVSLSLWSYSRRLPEVILELAEKLNIDTSSNSSIVGGLKNIEVSVLQTTSSSIALSQMLATNPRDGFAVGPTSEIEHQGALFTGRSHEKLSEGSFNQVPLLIGYNSLEGTFAFESAFRVFLLQFDLHPEKLIPIDLNVDPRYESDLAKKIKRHYFGLLPITLSNVQLMEYLSDDQFARAVVEHARQTSKRVPTYFYRFSYEGGLDGFHNRTLPGVAHSEELSYLFVSKHEPSTPHDLVVKSRMVQLWSNFIKYGNPTPNKDPLLQDVIWEPFDNQQTYLEIEEDLVLSQYPDQENLLFWDEIYAQYARPPHDTY